MNSFAGWIQSIHPMDWIALGLTLWLTLLGAFRGWRWQLRRFLAVLLSLALAGLLAPLAVSRLANVVDPERPRVALGLGYCFLFLFALAALSLTFRFLQKHRPRTEPEPHRSVSLSARIWGGVLGTGTSFLILLVLSSSALLLLENEPLALFVRQSRVVGSGSRIVQTLEGCFPIEASARARSTAPNAPRSP